MSQSSSKAPHGGRQDASNKGSRFNNAGHEGGQGSHSSSTATQAMGFGDDEFTDRRQPVYNPLDERPDSNVIARENAAEEERQISITGSITGSLRRMNISENTNFPVRPGFGKAGAPVILRTNHFALSLDPEKAIYRYHVDISKPKIPEGRKRRQFFVNMFREDNVCQQMSENHCLATDYAETLISVGELPLGPSDKVSFLLQYHEQDELARDNVKASQVTISLVGLVPTSELLQYLQSVPAHSPDFQNSVDSTIQAMNIIINATPNEKSEIYQPGRNVFAEYPRNGNLFTMNAYSNVNLGDGLIGVWGYYSSTKTSTGRILLNLHGHCSAFYPELNLHELMRTQCPGGRDIYALEKFLRKLRVRFRYMKDEKGQMIETIKTICGFSHVRTELRGVDGQIKRDKNRNPAMIGNADRNYGSSAQITFECFKYAPSTTITVAEYFKREYGITLKAPGMPAVNFGSDTRPIWIPAELGTVMPGQVYRGKLNENQTSKMLNIAARGPAENARRLVGAGAKVIGIQTGNPVLSAFGISVDTKMIVVPARILKAPKLEYGNKRIVISEDASWNLKGVKFYRPQRLENWSFLRCGRSSLSQKQVQTLHGQIEQYGLGNAAPSPAEGYHATLGQSDDDKTDEALEIAFLKAKKDGVKFLFVILETKSKPIHARLKFWADTKIGIHHTTLVSERLRTQKGRFGLANYFANVMQKVNMKIGGTNHVLHGFDSPRDSPLGFIAQKPTMLVGIDVSHPAPHSVAEAPSIVGVVASVDETFTQYLGSVTHQKGRVEMIADIGELMKERLSHFHRLAYSKNPTYPQNIIIYRDGVSEGQFKTVLDEEVTKIEAACKQVYGNVQQDPPKIVVIICGKRHHTRFYPTKPEDADSKHNYNTKNGTIVDRGVTSERYYDFFVQPHAALAGTARPEHCTVIRDDMSIGPDELQKTTHNLSYLYARATKAVSLCPPAYYADILCERGNKYLAKYLNRPWPPGSEFDYDNAPWLSGVHDELKDTMFYI